MIEALLEERHAEQMARRGDQEYFDNEYPKWERELRALRAMEAWSGGSGGNP